MKLIRFLVISAILTTVLALQASAQAGRTFVSGTGLDTNSCALTSPCRTFTRAISQTSPGGEVVVLTSAGYSPFSVTKAISIIAAPGVYAGVTASGGSGDGIDINAGTSDTVILRGLTVNNQGSTGQGIVFNTGGTLHVEDCVVNGFSSPSGGGGNGSAGIEIAGPGNIFVKDTVARGNVFGIFVSITAAGTAKVAMDRLHLDQNTFGLEVFALSSGAVVDAAIRDSSCSGNNNYGIIATQDVQGVASLDIERCLINGNYIGIGVSVVTGGSAAASISNCTITHNLGEGFAVVGTGANLYSRINNTIIGNGPSTGSLTTLTSQ